ncbi:hypothetical protein [Peribacillus sp. SCS-155]
METKAQAGAESAGPLVQYDAGYRNYVDEEEVNKELEQLQAEKYNTKQK